ncbi:MAG TPA: HD domain-containing protein [Tepidisphaeraceae bacterium]|nr:HD domain-containing protein [Tepidisphaeraceae bacterium]
MSTSPSSENLIARYQRVANSLHVATIVIDTAGKILAANDRLKALLGDAPDPCGSPLSQLVTQQIDPFGEENFEVESALITPTKTIPILLSVGPLSRGRRVLNIIDLTRLKEAENDRESSFRQVVEISNTVMEQALELRDNNKELEEHVRQRTIELRETIKDAILMLAIASEAKDNDTGQHVRRIERITRAISLEIGLSEHEADDFAHAAILHDIGKLQIPDAILNKPGPLDDDERFTMQQHTIAGERILSAGRFFRLAQRIARSHHENWDGSGYPEELVGEMIPLEARIVHVADVLDALIHSRVYKPAWPLEEALNYIAGAAGTQFDQDAVDAVIELNRREELRAIIGLDA